MEYNFLGLPSSFLSSSELKFPRFFSSDTLPETKDLISSLENKKFDYTCDYDLDLSLSLKPPVLQMKKRCHFCGKTETPLWRRGPYGKQTLCNACGLQLRKKQRKREFMERKNKMDKKATGVRKDKFME